MNELPTDRVSRNRKMNKSVKEVGLAVIKYESTAVASCSCGVLIVHQRSKILEDRIDRHLLKRHNGQGIRL